MTARLAVGAVRAALRCRVVRGEGVVEEGAAEPWTAVPAEASDGVCDGAGGATRRVEMTVTLGFRASTFLVMGPDGAVLVFTDGAAGVRLVVD